MPEQYPALPEQIFCFFIVDVWDSNCPPDIPRKINLEIVKPILLKMKSRIAELERELGPLRSKG